jgi:hypothetical protein
VKYKYSIISLISLVLFSLHLQAQPSFQWTKTGTSSIGHTYAEDIGTDRYRNVYVLLNSIDSLELDGHVASFQNTTNALASWDCNGNFRWMKVFSGKNLSTAMKVDSFGDVYVTGEINNLIASDVSYLDTDTVFTGKVKALYIAKYNALGTLQWLKIPMYKTVFSFPETAKSLDLSVTPDGKVFWYAYLNQGSYDNNAFSLPSPKYCAVTYSTSGVFQQLSILALNTTKPADISNGGEYFYFSRDPSNGRHYLGGTYDSSSMGALTIGSTPIVSNLQTIRPMVLAAFDSLGNNLWIKQGSPDKYSSITSHVAINKDGDIYIGGVSQPGNVFNGDTMQNPLGSTTFPFVMAMDSNGNKIWTSSGGAAYFSEVADIFYVNNTLAAIGTYAKQLQWGNVTTGQDGALIHDHFFLVRLNAATGAFVKLDTFIHSIQGNSGGNILSSDKNNNLYIGGVIYDQVTIGSNTLVGSNFGDLAITKYGSANCNCNIPQPEFTHTNTGNTYNFTYTGTVPYFSLSWTFGDGGTAGNVTNPSHHYIAKGNFPVCVTVTDGCGTNTACHTMYAPTALNDVPAFAATHVYPNPASGHLTVENAGLGTQLEIYSIVGARMVTTTMTATKEQLDISSLPSGMYLLRFTSRDGQHGTVKFVKQ